MRNRKAKAHWFAGMLICLASPVIAADPEIINLDVPGGNQPRRGVVVKDTWSVDCYLDEMFDRRYCVVRQNLKSDAIYSPTSDFCLRVNSDRSIRAWAEGEGYPGLQQVLRVDDRQPVTIDSDATLDVRASGFLKQLTTGARLRTRWYEWPSKKQHDQEISLEGLKDAMDVAEAIVANRALPVSDEIARIAVWEIGNFTAYLLGFLEAKYPEKCEELGQAEKLIGAMVEDLEPNLQTEFRAGYTARDRSMALPFEECERVLKTIERRLALLSLVKKSDRTDENE